MGGVARTIRLPLFHHAPSESKYFWIHLLDEQRLLGKDDVLSSDGEPPTLIFAAFATWLNAGMTSAKF
jgi:hypothetical protein